MQWGLPTALLEKAYGFYQPSVTKRVVNFKCSVNFETNKIFFCVIGARAHRGPVDGHRRRRRGRRRRCVSAYAPAHSGSPTAYWTIVLDQYYRVQQHETHSVLGNTVTKRRQDDGDTATTRSRRTHDGGELLLLNINTGQCN